MSGVPGDPDAYVPASPCILDDPVVWAFISAGRPPPMFRRRGFWPFREIHVTPGRVVVDLETSPGLEREIV